MKLDNALEYVLSLIQQGYEFPDAIYKASTKYRLTAKQVSALESAYDAQ